MKLNEAFIEWWERVGRFIDPDTSDVPWFDKRRDLCEIAWDAAMAQSSNYVADDAVAPVKIRFANGRIAAGRRAMKPKPTHLEAMNAAFRTYSPRSVPPTDADELAQKDDAHAMRDRLMEAEARADEMTRAHAASFGALSTLSAALLDGEVDDYQAVAQLVIDKFAAKDAELALVTAQVTALRALLRECEAALKQDSIVKPVRTSYTHKVCRGVTSIGRALAETYARNPWFYSGTFCVVCNVHRPLAEFEWRDGEPMDPHDPGFVHPKSADAS